MAKKNRKFKKTTGYLKKTKQGSRAQGLPSQQNLLKQALALHQAGRLHQAEALYRQILLNDPNHPEALQHLGMLAHQAGKSAIAVELINEALRRRPDYVDAFVSLGIILHDQGGMDEAAATFRRALTLNPDNADAHYNLGVVQQAQGQLAEAVSCYRQALTLNPDNADAHYNLGVVQQAQGKLAEAAASYRAALVLKPKDEDSCNNLGVVLYDQGEVDEAIDCFRRVLALNSKYIEAYYNLGNALLHIERLEEAEDSLRRLLVLTPDHAKAHNNLGNVLEAKGQFEEAAAYYQRALALKPDYADAYNNLGNVLKAQGQIEEAVVSYQKAITLQPDSFVAHSNLLLCLNYFPDQSISFYLQQARRFGRMASDKVRGCFTDWNCTAKPQRLRVGLVSGDFRNHPVGYFLENMLSNFDPARIEPIAYSSNCQEDELTERLRSLFVVWKRLPARDDGAAARLIHDDGVHILLDLSGHTAHNRLPVFAWKPAPVQASWLGYFASTGMTEMDYLIADPVSVPESHLEHFTEKVWFLPETRLCFSPPVIGEKLAVAPLPALHNGFITFGCFQEIIKLNDEVLAIWSRIFREMPWARLRLQNRSLHSPRIREQLQKKLARSGIEPQRVTFGGKIPRRDYLALHAHLDIILDTFPFPGGTTTCEALWMGVPTMTLAGETMLGRQGASLLTSAGLGDWVAKDKEEYVAKTIAYASDLEKLSRLRAGLRQQVLASPLFDGTRFARRFETALWGMWRRFQAGG